MPAFEEWESFYLIVGGVTLALLFIGIHNSWDAIAYHVFVTMQRRRE